MGGACVDVYALPRPALARPIPPHPTLPYPTPQHCQKELKAALDLIADPSNHPVMFHCEYGKDRTGIIAALIFTCAGVSRESIVTDYVQSQVSGWNLFK